jgi:hypothetical protein
MNRDDIIRMAQEAGWEMGRDLTDGFGTRLLRFAELVYMNGYDAGVKDGLEGCVYLLERLHERQGPEPSHNYYLFAAKAIKEMRND